MTFVPSRKGLWRASTSGPTVGTGLVTRVSGWSSAHPAVQAEGRRGAVPHTVRGDRARGLYRDPNGGRTLFQDYAETRRAGHVHHRPSTAVQLETYLRVHAYSTLGRRQLGAIRRSDI